MAQYSPGDVIIARVPFVGTGGAKVRPAVIIGLEEGNILKVIAVSSRPAGDAPCIPVSLEDFISGGLDMFEESYVLLSRVQRIGLSDVAGKKGHLNPAFMDDLLTRVGDYETPRRK